jgi:ABC-type Mn2+/Zn2+ transport system ATPase subunit
MITRIEATRYRCLERLDADLDTYAVLVGANGAGKTTFLDIPGMLGDCLQQREVGQAFTTRQHGRPPRSSTLNELVFSGDGTFFNLAVEAALPEEIVNVLLPYQSDVVKNHPERWLRFVRYEVRFEIFNSRELHVGNEYLFLFARTTPPERDDSSSKKLRLYGEGTPHREWRVVLDRPLVGKAAVGRKTVGLGRKKGNVGFRPETSKTRGDRSTNVDAGVLALPRVLFESADEFPATRWFFDLLTKKTVFYHPDIDLLQTASPPGLADDVMPNAANLPWLVLELQKDKDRFNPWVEHVKTALPQIKGIRAKEREEDHHAYLAVKYNGGYEVTSSGLSEGTLRVLALTILPYLQKRPAVIITEEPENGIHPQAIEAVLQSLGSVYDSQVLISSHSPVVLAMSKLDQILCSRVAANGGATIIKGTEHPRLKEWKGSIDLGSLFAAGVLR